MALVAAGVGSTALGVFTVLTEASEWVGGVHGALRAGRALERQDDIRRGCVAGCVGMLHGAWRSKEVSWMMAWTLTLVLLGVGFVLTFPPVFLAFAPEE